MIGWALGIAASTVHAVLAPPRPLAAGRPAAAGARSSATSAPQPGELVHVDSRSSAASSGRATASPAIARAGRRQAGWQYLFVAIDDHSRLGFAPVYPDETARLRDRLPRRARPLLPRARDHGRARADRQRQPASSAAGPTPAPPRIAVKKTRPYRPQTNGKAERFIRTLLERWAYAYPYENESERLAALAPTLDFYNRFRPHRALGGLTPLQRVNNLPGTYT